MTRCILLSRAHKGNDYLSVNPKDTTESHMKVSVDLACEGGIRFKKTDVVIPRVPRVNGILLGASSGRWKTGRDG